MWIEKCTYSVISEERCNSVPGQRVSRFSGMDVNVKVNVILTDKRVGILGAFC